MKIAWRCRADKRTFPVLVIIPAHVEGQLVANIHAQVGYRLLILVLHCAERLQNVELRHAAVNTGDAVADVGQHSLRGLEPDGGHSEISVVRVVRVGHQVIGRIVPCTIVVIGIGHEGKDHPGWRRVVEADDGILDHAVEVVREIQSEAFARRQRRGQPVVLVVAHVLGLCVGIGFLQDIDGSAQGRPRARCVGRLEAIARFLARRQADEHGVVVRVLQIEIQSQGMGGPRPEPEERRFLQSHEMVQVAGQKIIEVVEVPVAIAVTDARPRFFRNVPGQFGLISRPGLVEG